MAPRALGWGGGGCQRPSHVGWRGALLRGRSTGNLGQPYTAYGSNVVITYAAFRRRVGFTENKCSKEKRWLIEVRKSKLKVRNCISATYFSPQLIPMSLILWKCRLKFLMPVSPGINPGC
jgi:hypothetical protein